MVDCVPADDAFLVGHFPGVVVSVPERWLVTVAAPALPGTYSVTVQGAPFEATATVPPDTAGDVRDALVKALAQSLTVAVTPQGTSSLLVDGLAPGDLGVLASGPAANTITAALVWGGDDNAAFRALWLTAALCGLPPCCAVTCAGDYTLMHAALAAHLIYALSPGNISGAGQGALDWDSMRLGPAALSRRVSAWASSGAADADLAKTPPGSLFLMIRARYVMPFLCA